MKDIKNMTNQEINNLTAEDLNATINDTLNQLFQVFSSVSRNIAKLEEYKKKSSPEDSMLSEVDQMLDYAKTKLKESIVDTRNIASDIYQVGTKILTPTNQSLKMGKSFVETMSKDAYRYQEAIQKTRDERYEKMIEEAEEKYGPIESPMDRLRRR